MIIVAAPGTLSPSCVNIGLPEKEIYCSQKVRNVKLLKLCKLGKKSKTSGPGCSKHR